MARRLDPALVTLHPFGCLVIALYDGAFLAAAVAVPEADGHAIQRRKRENRKRKPGAAIAWATGTAR